MKALIICPNFEGEECHFLNILKKLGYDTCVKIYNEDFFKKQGLLTQVTNQLLKTFRFRQIAKKIRWREQAYMSFLVDTITQDYDLVLIVKPFLYRVDQFDCEINKKAKKIIFYNYDTINRFPINVDVIKKYRNSFISFDLDDAVKNNLVYSPIPRSDKKIEPVIDKSNVISFYGAFSIFRFFRLAVIYFSAKKCGLKPIFYLRLLGLKKTVKFFGVFIGSERRKSKNTKILIDVPQNIQEGGSARSVMNDQSLLITYSVSTPHWRHLDVTSLWSTYQTSLKIFKTIKSKNYKQLLMEEQNATEDAFKTALDSALK